MLRSTCRWRPALATFILILTALVLAGPLDRTARAAEELPVGAGLRFTTIQAAIDAALEGDTVKVEPGAYLEAIDFKGKKIRVFSASGSGATTIDATGLLKTSVATFKTGETAECILEGFTLTGGTGVPLTPTSTVQLGGGVFIDKSAPTIRRCEIKLNAATKGGGVWVQGLGGGGLIEDCDISENTAKAASGAGGGGVAGLFSVAGPGLLTLRNCNVFKNAVPAAGVVQGGGAHFAGTNAQAKIVITGCTFTENRVGSQAASGGDGGGLYLDTVPIEMEGGEVSGNQALKGGGLAVRSLGVASFIKGTAVKGNTALTTGGGGGFYFPTGGNPRLTISGVEISDNNGGSAGGGGMWVEAGAPVIDSCKFLNNSTTQDGGAIRYISTGAKTRINATLFQGNQAGEQGGAVYISGSAATTVVYSNCVFTGNRASTGGGGVDSGTTNAAGMPKFFYCTFVGNTGGGTAGGGIHFVAGGPGMITNCILWNNTPTDLPAVDATKITYSNTRNPTFLTRTGMLSEDPEFVNAAANPPDFRLKNTSPLIDKGFIGTDLDLKPPAIPFDYEGKERIADGDGDSVLGPDMGAYEIVLGPVIKPKFVRGICRHSSVEVVEGLRIDVGDAIYLLRWRFAGYPEPGCVKACDADDTGVVDLSDAVYILNYLFRGSNQAPKAPFPALGEDPTPDILSCIKGKV